MTSENIARLNTICRQYRIDTVELLHERQTGHAGGSLSVCEILVALYHECANINRDNYTSPERDRIILSKGHAAPMLYRCLAGVGIIDQAELHTLRKLDSRLQGHPCSRKTPGVELSTGPLGLGLSAGVGMACANRLLNSEAFVLEGAMSAAKFGCDRLIAILDWNKVQLDGMTEQVMPMHDMEQRWRSFGWNVCRCDGHIIEQLCSAIEQLKAQRNGKPSIILADTVKGKGVSFMENTNKYHGKAIDDDEYRRAMAELKG